MKLKLPSGSEIERCEVISDDWVQSENTCHQILDWSFISFLLHVKNKPNLKKKNQTVLQDKQWTTLKTATKSQTSSQDLTLKNDIGKSKGREYEYYFGKRPTFTVYTVKTILYVKCFILYKYET